MFKKWIFKTFILLFILCIAFSTKSLAASKNKSYKGSLSTNLKTIYLGKNQSGSYYLYGQITAEEWISGKRYTPSKLPSMKIKSTDGKINKKITVKKDKIGKYTYSYKIFINKLKEDIDYYIEVSLTNKNNTSKNKTKKIGTKNNKYIGKINKNKVVTYRNINKVLTINIGKYKGDISAKLKNIYSGNNIKGNYIHGEITIKELILNSTLSPLGLPTLQLKSKDGTVSKKMYIKKTGTYTYYYDVFIDGLDTSKKYYIEISLARKNNISTKAAKKINIGLNDLWGSYGKSVKGQSLEYYKIGNGKNILFAVFEQHGFEDAWKKDGQELVTIGNNFITSLKNHSDNELFDKWTIYVIPKANPDGLLYGTTNNGIGRCTYSRI